MDDLAVNKIIAAILGGLMIWMFATLVSDAVVAPTLLKKPAIAIATPAPPGAPSATPTIAELLQTASAARGKADTERVGCTACHDFAKGGHTIVGPDLYNMVGQKIAAVPGFDFSGALKQHHGDWTYQKLFQWLKDPAAFAPGTKMTFAGLPDAKERADIIMYLRSLSPNPKPLPPAPKKPATAALASMNPAQKVAFRLQTASPKAGHAIMERVGCTACHSITKGGPVIVGPPLYGVVGRPVASVPGFAYSDALKKHHGPWTYAELFQWIRDPAKYAPGTKMTFPGLPNAEERADVIAFLRTLSPHPEPLPSSPIKATAAKPGAPKSTNAVAAPPPAASTSAPKPAAVKP